MKNKEQIELAQETIELLQDYIELAKTHKKLKRCENKEVIEDQVERVLTVIKNYIEQL